MTQLITRQRHNARRRTLFVKDIIRLTPHMLRIELKGDMEGFASLSPDDHVKLFFDTGAGKPVMRDYTPRAFDVAAGRLTLDFAVHEAGPATDWAVRAKVGDTLVVGGPRGSAVIAPIFDWWLLIGDETALPAIGRRIEETSAQVKVITIIGITSDADRQDFATNADLTCNWIIRSETDAANPSVMLEALKLHQFPAGKGFVWIAAEAAVARALRNHIRDERGHPAEWIKAAGYWTKGQADASDKTLD